MTEREIYDGVIMSGTADFILVAETLRRHGAGWCVIGGLAVNSYATPVYTADLDLVVITTDLEPVLAAWMCQLPPWPTWCRASCGLGVTPRVDRRNNSKTGWI